MVITELDDSISDDKTIYLTTEPKFTSEHAAVFAKKYGVRLESQIGKIRVDMADYLRWNAAAHQGSISLKQAIEEMLTAVERIVDDATKSEMHRREVMLKGIADALGVPRASKK